MTCLWLEAGIIKFKMTKNELQVQPLKTLSNGATAFGLMTLSTTTVSVTRPSIVASNLMTLSTTKQVRNVNFLSRIFQKSLSKKQLL
jgi:hypothetical protein